MTAKATNPTKKPLKDSAVFGFVSDEKAGASVIANNPDFRSDAGQFAQIDNIEPGQDVPVEFVFVGTFSKRDQQGEDYCNSHLCNYFLVPGSLTWLCF